MCEVAKRIHLRFKLCKDHIVVQLSESIATEASCERLVCTPHHMEAITYCKTCVNVAVCLECILTQHNGHTFCKLEEAVIATASADERCKSHFGAMDVAVKVMSDMSTALHAVLVKSHAAIDAYKVEIDAAVVARCAELHKELRHVGKARSFALEDQISLITLLRTNLDQNVQQVKIPITSANVPPFDVIHYSRKYEQLLLAVEKNMPPLAPSTDADVVVVFSAADTDIIAALRHAGAIKTGAVKEEAVLHEKATQEEMDRQHAEAARLEAERIATEQREAAARALIQCIHCKTMFDVSQNQNCLITYHWGGYFNYCPCNPHYDCRCGYHCCHNKNPSSPGCTTRKHEA